MIVAEGLTTGKTTIVLDGAVILPLRFVVKRIKDKLYVYLQGRENGKIVTKYIGPLDKIAEFYLRAKSQDWCGGWDLNPRRPSPADLKSAPFDQARAPPHQFIVYYVVSLYFLYRL